MRKPRLRLKKSYEGGGLYLVEHGKAVTEESALVPSIVSSLERRSIQVPHAMTLQVLRGKYASGSASKAVELINALMDAEDGIIREIRLETPLLGAENNRGVSCYLDAILFSLYARHTSFEAMLFNIFQEPSKRRLSMLLRLWINLLRSGKLITTDITAQLQQSLEECGWQDVGGCEQQDASEAFCFITDTLSMPLLTLKVNIAHAGREDKTDDHKIINERLLHVPIGDRDGPPIDLEECLEEYFSNRVDVRRTLERRGTLESVDSVWLDSKICAAHVEAVEIRTPTRESPTGISPKKQEVALPAWQFFQLLPFYTFADGQPLDPTTSQHFAELRPVLGICLKRFGMDGNGPFRNDRRIFINNVITLPTFIAPDADKEPEDGAIYGNYVLHLHSAVCHRGKSIDSGHYIALVREPDGKWLRFDDLAKPRVQHVDPHKAFPEECPYILFYELQEMEPRDDRTDDASTGTSQFSSQFQDEDGIGRKEKKHRRERDIKHCTII